MGLFSPSKRNTDHEEDLAQMHKEYVHGHTVYYARDAHHGVYYLKRDLQRDEARVFFDGARRSYKREAEFEDDHDREYTLSYMGNKKYKLERR